jgi:hypothetical protein
MDIPLILVELSCELLRNILCIFEGALTTVTDNSWSLWCYTNRDIAYRWNPRRDVFGVCSTWVLVIMLGALLGVKIVQLIDARGKTLACRVDILRDRFSPHGSGRARGGLEPERPKGWGYPARVLFGKTLWETTFPCVIHFRSAQCQRSD